MPAGAGWEPSSRAAVAAIYEHRTAVANQRYKGIVAF